MSAKTCRPCFTITSPISSILLFDRTDVERFNLKQTSSGRSVSLNSWINQLMCRWFIVGRLGQWNIDDVRRWRVFTSVNGATWHKRNPALNMATFTVSTALWLRLHRSMNSWSTTVCRAGSLTAVCCSDNSGSRVYVSYLSHSRPSLLGMLITWRLSFEYDVDIVRKLAELVQPVHPINAQNSSTADDTTTRIVLVQKTVVREYIWWKMSK